ncbi:hypothetical protein AAFF_G00142570 [Aldrovandia affinis]|uniref:Uncharacterized protein n=1 Tax=Aldrovandia affinis TaxID=143900 RepID=A0AAD7WWV3_9TELE|nr:hypothetical protein AAFF_G00142570 [Aldrovandia affinis]
MQDLTTKENVNRLPILVSGNGTVQLLNVPKLPNGTGSEMAKAVVGALKDWDLTERIGGMSFDTTSSNTGRNNGACVLIEQQLKKDLLYFACRHHVLELPAEAFKTVMGPMSGPNVTMFKRFQDHWQFIDRSQFESAAPRHDLQLLKDLTTYMDNVNWDVGKAALTKLQGHLWYLSRSLSLWQSLTPGHGGGEEANLTSLHTTVGDESPAKRPKLRLEDGFLDADPATWLEREDFRTAAAFVQGIAVINDHAERGVALIQEYNRKLTQDEEQLQFLLQVVSRHRAEFPDSRKKTVAAGVAA